MFLKLSLNILLNILVMAMAFCVNSYKLNGLTSLHYNLKISLMPGYVSHGESNITVYIRGPTRDITLLTSKYINVTTVYLISVDNKKIYMPKLSYSRNKYNVVLNFTEDVWPKNNLAFGLYILYVNFSNFKTEKLPQTWYTDDKEDKKFIATLFQSTNSQPLFPCFYTSELVTFNILVEHDRRFNVLSNMPIKNQSISNDVMLTHFHTYPVTYIYDITLILMTSDMAPTDPIEYNSDPSPSSKMKINTWSRSHLVPHMKFAQQVLGNVTMYLEDNWKILRKGPKVDYVVIPNFEGNIKQTWGLLLYNETYITYDKELYPAAYKGIAMRSITHDIIYQWFGGLFYPSRYYWSLNEGFIKFVEGYVIDKIYPNSRMIDLFIIQDQHEYYYMDMYYPLHVYGSFKNDTFKINSHFIRQLIIGPIVWRMLASVIPHDVFWESINTFLNPELINVDSRLPDNLWDIMQTTIDKLAIKNYKINVKRMLSVWTEQKYCPGLNAIRDYNGAYVNISIDKKQLFDQTFFMPITYTTEKNINFNTNLSTIDHYLTESNPELKITIKNEYQWIMIIVNKQQTGYYHVNYDVENWRRIARYLNSENYTNIHVLNRAQIINDAFHLATEKKLDFSIFWDLASYLPRREKDYIAWYPMIKVFEYLSNYFAIINVYDKNFPRIFIEEASIKIKELLEHKNIYTFLHKNESIDNQMGPERVEDDFNKYLKLELTKWGCLINNSLCIKMAKNKLELYVQNSTLNKISPGWEEWTYCNGLKTANDSMWYTVYLMASRMYKEKSNDKMLKYLGCSENPDVIVKYLLSVIPEFKKNILRDNDHTQKNKDKIDTLITNMFLSTLARHTKNILVLKEILPSFKLYYKDSSIRMTKILNVLINNIYTAKPLTEIRKFAKEHMPSLYYKYIERKLENRYYKQIDQLKFYSDLFR